MSPPVARYVEQVMGMPISLALRGKHTADDDARDAWSAVLDDLQWTDAVFSTWRDDSVVSRIARNELDVADAPPEVRDVVQIGNAAERATAGAFSLHPHARFDLTGVVKGWAIERAARRLHLLDDTDFCLSAGGDMQGRVIDPARPWRIGIEDPHEPRRILATVPLVDGAVATSGTAHRGTHVVDARTGLPPERVAQVTVIARSLTDADVDATAAYALGPGAAAWLRHRAQRSALIVDTYGRTEIVKADSLDALFEAHSRQIIPT